MSVDIHTGEIKPLRNSFANTVQYVRNDKPKSRYQEATLGAHSTANFHYHSTWDLTHEIFDASRSAIKLVDWSVLRYPRKYYYATWSMACARQQGAIKASYQFVDAPELVRGVDLRTIDIVLGHTAGSQMLPQHLTASGDCLPASTLILSGGITKPVAVHAGDNFTLRVQGMGSTCLRFCQIHKRRTCCAIRTSSHARRSHRSAKRAVIEKVSAALVEAIGGPIANVPFWI